MGDIKNYSLAMEKGEEEDISEGELKDDDDDDEDNNYIKYRFKSEFEEGELNEEKLNKHDLNDSYKLKKLDTLDNIHLTKQVSGNIDIINHFF